MIIISGHFRGPELKQSRVSHAIGAAMRSMETAREPDFGGSLGKVPHVNAVFFVAGSLGPPGFEDVRIGPYSRKDKCVQVDIAVPQTAVDADSLRDTIVRGLRMANAAAFLFFEDKDMEFPLREAEELVTRVGEELTEYA